MNALYTTKTLVLVTVASLVVLGANQAQAIKDQTPMWQQWMDRIQDYMERDLEPCKGVTVTLDIMSVSSKRAPSPDCHKACQQQEDPKKRSFQDGDFKYSGSSVLCCCGRS